jgi:hypothetical protein
MTKNQEVSKSLNLPLSILIPEPKASGGKEPVAKSAKRSTHPILRN